MNTGQMMLTMGALALFSMTALNITRSFNTSGQAILRAKCGLAATSLATSMVEEASGRYFDAATADSAVTKTTALTSPNGLGPRADEKYPNFNDFDDYNNLYVKLFLALPDTFHIKCKVVYINPVNPEVASTVATWHKKLTVSVTSPVFVDTIKSEYIFSYWYFR
ncbi:MAG: hypothetical protein HYZ34_07985 [Ignavibacteriae bacterium]|nr:hypothetical protein [Ignavibacteriota bacterium]